jgi:hypothetical protein
MAFIGNTVTTQGFVPAIDTFSGNASTTAFTLSRPVASVAQVEAVISNVVQDPNSAYTVSGNTLTFTSAPPSGTNNIYVRYTSLITQTLAPGLGTVAINSFSATGTPSSSTYLRGDNTWSTVSGGVTSFSAGTTGFTPSTGTTGAVTLAGTLASANGGTGLTSPGTTGNVLTSNGSAWTSATPTAVNSSQLAKAWINYKGTATVSIRASYNVSSVTVNGSGDYTINFTSAFADTNYAVTGGAGTSAGGAGYRFLAVGSGNSGNFSMQTTSVRVQTAYDALNKGDADVVCIAVYR